MCRAYDCTHNKRGMCIINQELNGGPTPCKFYRKPIDRRTSINHGPVYPSGRHRVIKWARGLRNKQ